MRFTSVHPFLVLFLPAMIWVAFGHPPIWFFNATWFAAVLVAVYLIVLAGGVVAWPDEAMVGLRRNLGPKAREKWAASRPWLMVVAAVIPFLEAACGWFWLAGLTAAAAFVVVRALEGRLASPPADVDALRS